MEQAGLVLEGGGMRGIFTAGVLDFFLEQNIHFQSCIGVSAGACHACSYLAGQHGRALRVSTEYLEDKRYCSAYSLITTGDLFGVKMTCDLIPNQLEPYDYQAFLENPAALYVVVTNCLSGEAEYHRITDMKKDIISVRASSSLPLVSRMVSINGKKYLDGGVTDSIPIEQSIQLGNQKNVVVLTQHLEYRKRENKSMRFAQLRYVRYPKLVERMRNRHLEYNETLDHLEQMERAGKVFIIRPQAPLSLKRIEKDRDKLIAVYHQGYRQAERLLPQMRQYLSWQ